MRSIAVILCVLAGCDADDAGVETPAGDRSIEFLLPGTLEPLPVDTPVDVYVRTQGPFGADLDIRVYGVAMDDAAPFSIGFVGPTDHALAEQKFLPTSTAEPLDDGFTIAQLPVVFFEDVEQSEVDDAPATLRATMMTTPATTGELDVTLALRD